MVALQGYYTGNVNSYGNYSNNGSYNLDYDDDGIPPLELERGSSFSWETVIGGCENGVVYLTEPGMYRDLKQMIDTDGKACSIENLLVYPIVSASREIVGTKGDKGEAEKITEILTDSPYEGGMSTPLDVLILQMTGALTYKRAYFEKIFRIRDSDGLIGYRDIAWRAPETCELALNAKTGRYVGFRQQKIHYEWGATASNSVNDFGYTNFEKNVAFVYTHGSWRDPIEGISSMQVPFWCHHIKRRFMHLWYQYLDTSSLPKIIASNNDEAKAIRDASRLATLKSRGTFGKGTDTTIDTLESSGRGADQFVEAIRYLDSEMSHSILAGFMDLSSMAAAGKGSFALSEDQSKLFLRTRRIVAYDMARQFNEQVIAPLCRYNFGRKASCPKLVFGPMSETNEQSVIDAYIAMVESATNSTSAGGIAVPDELFDEITVRVASILELDFEKVQKAIKLEGSTLARLRKATEVALKALQTNDAMKAGKTSTTPEQYLTSVSGNGG